MSRSPRRSLIDHSTMLIYSWHGRLWYRFLARVPLILVPTISAGTRKPLTSTTSTKTSLASLWSWVRCRAMSLGPLHRMLKSHKNGIEAEPISRLECLSPRRLWTIAKSLGENCIYMCVIEFVRWLYCFAFVCHNPVHWTVRQESEGVRDIHEAYTIREDKRWAGPHGASGFP